MERGEAEAVYDAGRATCVEFLIELAARHERQIARLEGRIERLEQQVRQSSRNSSKPPSEDPPKTREQRRAEAREKAKQAKRGARHAGGQPGHPGTGRELAPEDQVDQIVDHYPAACGGCGSGFGESDRESSGHFGRYQQAELPQTSVILTEHRAHRLRCPGCGARSTAQLPGGIAGSAFGPALQAAIVTMTARNRVSRRDMSELASELFGVGLSTGAVDAICQRASAALVEPHERLCASVLDSPALNLDETGWRTAGEGRTLWTATTTAAAIFRLAPDRHRDRLEELIGKDFDGIACSDRWWAYDHLDPRLRQCCWQHLFRDFRRHSEGLAEQKLFGEAGLALTGRLFEAWQAFGGHQDRERLAAEMEPIQTAMRKLLEHAGRKSKRSRLHRTFANNLLKIWPGLWTFVTVEGVEPTNNAAERSLRGPVIHRKLSHGTRSDDGERFVERALSASVTCRLQRRSLFAYLTELLTARARGQPLPALA
ncbi:MAG: IS66 family transposase [Thermoleophilaceae bacterium]